MPGQNPHIVDFKRLPGHLQSQILDLQSPGDDRFAFFDRLPLFYLVPVLAAIGWLIYLYTASQQPMWDDWMYYLVCGISMVVVPLVFLGALKLLGAVVFSRLKSGYLFTKDNFLKTNGSMIEVWSLRDLDALRLKDDDREIEIWIGDREETIKAGEIDNARKLDRLFDGWKASAGEGLGVELGDPAYKFGASSRMAVIVAGVLVSMLIGFGTGYLFAGVNRNFDDELTWATAQQVDSIDEFENYKARHPRGAFAADADRKIGERVAKLKDDYLASVAKGADPAAVGAYASVLEQVAKRPDRTIYIRVAETREIDDSVVDTLADGFHITMNGYDVSVPASGAEFRKNKVFSDLRVLLTDWRNRGVIRFELTDALPADSPAIDVSLLIKSERTFFRVTSLEDGRMQVSNYPGASFLFRIELRDSTSSPAYHMEYVGQPLAVNSGGFDRRDKDNYSFDKLYFSTVTDGFDRTIQQTLGLATVTDSAY